MEHVRHNDAKIALNRTCRVTLRREEGREHGQSVHRKFVPFAVVPGSSRTTPASRSTCAHRSGSTSDGTPPVQPIVVLSHAGQILERDLLGVGGVPVRGNPLSGRSDRRL
jgi:hypothetical protein